MSLPGAYCGGCGVASMRYLVTMGAPEGTGHSGGDCSSRHRSRVNPRQEDSLELAVWCRLSGQTECGQP